VHIQVIIQFLLKVNVNRGFGASIIKLRNGQPHVPGFFFYLGAHQMIFFLTFLVKGGQMVVNSFGSIHVHGHQFSLHKGFNPFVHTTKINQKLTTTKPIFMKI
jgi:hypothetical protein